MSTTNVDPWDFPLPAGWRRAKLKYISTLKGRLGWQNLRADEYTLDGPYLVTSEHFTNDRVDWDRCHHVSEDRFAMAPEIQLRVHDLLMMKDGAAMGKLAYVDSLPAPACLNSHLLLFRPIRNEFLNRFLYYVLTTPLFTTYMEQERTGTTFFGISQESMGGFPLSFPPTSRQAAIVAYLDRRTAQIDDLIARKERLIELMEEKRQAVVSHAVTRGLDPAVPLRDSGVPWLGAVPEHWTVRRLKFLLSTPIEQGWSPVCDNREAGEEEWAVLKVGCVNGQEFDPCEHKALPAETPPEVRYSVREDDILMSRGNTRELVGNAALVRDVRPRLLLSDLLYRFRVDSRKALPEFVVRSLRSSLLRFQIELVADGSSSSMKKIGQQDIRELLILLPPMSEQMGIVRRIRSISDHLNRVTARARAGIARLQEYRTALISAAVTGQIDVRDEVTR